MLHPLRTVKAYRRLRRYREVIFTLIKYGFDDIVHRIGPEYLLHRGLKKPKHRRPETPTPARLRLALTDLGPTFVKFGQLLSTRPDILPVEYITELEKLQDKVPPFSFDDVKRIFLEEFGAEPEKLFVSFEEAPIASGSIAQVHKAILRSGDTAAIKIQRPNIARLIETDLSILEEVAKLIENHIEEFRWFRPVELVKQFAATIRRELDFVAEAQSAERFHRNFGDELEYFIPRVFWDFSTERILALQFIDGIKITDEKSLDEGDFDKKTIARNGAQACLKEVFEHRFFHADPHPGNFFVLDGNVIASFDFGIVGHLDEETADNLGGVLSAFVRRDVSEIVRIFNAMGLLEETVDRSVLRLDLIDLIDRYYGLPLKKIDAERVINDALHIFRRHRMTLPVNLVLIGRMLAVAGGVGRMLDPDFDLIQEAKPYVTAFMAQRLDPRRKLSDLIKIWKAYQAIIEELPADLEEILKKVKKGKMSVALHHEGLTRFILEIDRSSNRLTFGLIVASLIIGSSLVMQLESGPQFYGFPVLGLSGYLIAGILGLWLVIAILRSGRI